MQDYQERRAIRTELKGLAKEERQRQERAVKEVLGRAAVVCSTLSGIGVRMLHGATFDVAVIDEAAQVSQFQRLNPSVLVALLVEISAQCQKHPT